MPALPDRANLDTWALNSRNVVLILTTMVHRGSTPAASSIRAGALHDRWPTQARVPAVD
jgi:hypothetical protein